MFVIILDLKDIKLNPNRKLEIMILTENYYDVSKFKDEKVMINNLTYEEILNSYYIIKILKSRENLDTLFIYIDYD
jgi:hypothetical protein